MLAFFVVFFPAESSETSFNFEKSLPTFLLRQDNSLLQRIFPAESLSGDMQNFCLIINVITIGRKLKWKSLNVFKDFALTLCNILKLISNINSI